MHTHFRHLPDEFDDYVANPKPNGYQSIHTVVLGPRGKTVEIQIRTRQMHEDAELGVAAHWKYKEGAGVTVRSGYEEHRTAAQAHRGRKRWRTPARCSTRCAASFDDRVYVFTPKGDVVDRPPAHAARFRLPYSQRRRSPLYRRQDRRPHRAIYPIS